MWWSELRTAPRRTLFIKVNHEDFVWLGIPLKVATDSGAKAVWLDEQPEAEVLSELFYLRNGRRFHISDGEEVRIPVELCHRFHSKARKCSRSPGFGGCFGFSDYQRRSHDL